MKTRAGSRAAQNAQAGAFRFLPALSRQLIKREGRGCEANLEVANQSLARWGSGGAAGGTPLFSFLWGQRGAAQPTASESFTLIASAEPGAQPPGKGRWMADPHRPLSTPSPWLAGPRGARCHRPGALPCCLQHPPGDGTRRRPLPGMSPAPGGGRHGTRCLAAGARASSPSLCASRSPPLIDLGRAACPPTPYR